MQQYAPNHSKRCGSTWGWSCWRCRELLGAADSAEFERRRQRLFPAPAPPDFSYLTDARYLETLADAILANKTLFGPIIQHLAGKVSSKRGAAQAANVDVPTVEYLIPLEEDKSP